jgi:GH24 family phage-related lysozyme (muramidase)
MPSARPVARPVAQLFAQRAAWPLVGNTDFRLGSGADIRLIYAGHGVTSFLYTIRRVSLLIGAFLVSLDLPVLAQGAVQHSGRAMAPAATAPATAAAANTAASTAAATAASTPGAPVAARLMDSYELCKIGRLGQNELAFLTVFILIGCFVFFLQIDKRLIQHGWEIKKALSESTTLSYVPGDGSAEPALNESGEPQTFLILVPSVSRLIALAGLIMLILFYFAFGILSVYHFGRTCEMPGDIKGVTSFLYAGLTFFAPYIATKLSEIFAPSSGRRLPLPSFRTEQNLASLQPRSLPSPPFISQPRIASPIPVQQDPVVAPEAPSNTPTPAPAPVALPASQVVPTAAPAPPSPSLNGHSEALKLISEFEGFRDIAYPDPATGSAPWTIGYGFTRLNGRAVTPGQRLTRAEADQILASMIAACSNHLASSIPHWREMSAKQQSSLISFAWNLGQNFYGNEADFQTISRCLREKDWNNVADALMLYCMPGTAVHQGLLRRRNAEADLWRQGMATLPSAARVGSPSRPIAAGASPAQGAVAKDPAAVTVSASVHPNPLVVSYFDQMLMDDGQGWRDCFSASCAMLAHYWGKLKGDGNTYNRIRQKHGDSTDSNAQLLALRSLGLKAEFRINGTPEILKAEIDAGRPVAVGWLHHGHVTSPSGGGHWTVVIGYNSTGFWMNDPYGSCDLVGGGYPGGANPNDTLGKKELYSNKNWLPRWMPSGSLGWYLTCSL